MTAPLIRGRVRAMSRQITASRVTKEERKAIAQADEVARRRQHNKAAPRARRRTRRKKD